jgi:Skp family chaperone for outer membrane proteins
MTYWKWIPFLTAVLIAVVVAPPELGAQTGKVAVINTEKIIAESAAGIAAEAEFSAWLTPLQQELSQMQADITQKSQELETQRIALSAEGVRQKQQELDRLDTTLQRRTEDLQAEAGTKQQELLGPVLMLADEALDGMTSGQNYSLIFDIATMQQIQSAVGVGGIVVYLAPTADLSTELIRRMDDIYASRGGSTGTTDLSLPATGAATEPSISPPPAAPATTAAPPQP